MYRNDVHPSNAFEFKAVNTSNEADTKDGIVEQIVLLPVTASFGADIDVNVVELILLIKFPEAVTNDGMFTVVNDIDPVLSEPGTIGPTVDRTLGKSTVVNAPQSCIALEANTSNSGKLIVVNKRAPCAILKHDTNLGNVKLTIELQLVNMLPLVLNNSGAVTEVNDEQLFAIVVAVVNAGTLMEVNAAALSTTVAVEVNAGKDNDVIALHVDNTPP